MCQENYFLIFGEWGPGFQVPTPGSLLRKSEKGDRVISVKGSRRADREASFPKGVPSRLLTSAESRPCSRPLPNPGVPSVVPHGKNS
jgi:hypothetical protein